MKTIEDSFALLLKLLRENWPLLLIAFLLLEFTQHHFINLINIASQNQDDVTKMIASLGQALTALTEYIFFSMLVPLRVMESEDPSRTKQSFAQFSQKHILALSAEGLRSLGVILLWTLLFVVPGFFKYLRLFFVPYVVVADPKYESGDRDALEYSNKLVKGFTVQLFLIISALFCFELFRDGTRTNHPLLEMPLRSLIGGGLFFIISLYANILLFKIYQLRVKVYSAK